MGKGEITRREQFLLFQQRVKDLYHKHVKTRKNQDLFGRELITTMVGSKTGMNPVPNGGLGPKLPFSPMLFCSRVLLDTDRAKGLPCLCMLSPKLFITQSGLLTTLYMKSLENIVGKGENAAKQHFLLLPQCFMPFPKQISSCQLYLFCRLHMLSIWTKKVEKIVKILTKKK